MTSIVGDAPRRTSATTVTRYGALFVNLTSSRTPHFPVSLCALETALTLTCCGLEGLRGELLHALTNLFCEFLT